MTRRYRHDVIEKHHWLSNNSSGYILWNLYPELQAKHKNEILNPGLNKSLGLPEGRTVTLYELCLRTGGYDSILLSFIFSFGKDLESFFREYLTHEVTDIVEVLDSYKMKGNVFQRLHDVSRILVDRLHINLKQDSDFQNLGRFMQIRHIYMHRDGLVDKKFLSNVDIKLDESDRYPLDYKELSSFFSSFRAILRKLDERDDP